MKKCLGVGCAAKCVKESREKRKRKKTKGEGLALVAKEKQKEKQEKEIEKGNGLGWVWGQGVNKYIKRIEYIWVTPVHNIVKIYYKNVVNITLFEKRNVKAKYIFTKSFIKRVIYY